MPGIGATDSADLVAQARAERASAPTDSPRVAASPGWRILWIPRPMSPPPHADRALPEDRSRSLHSYADGGGRHLPPTFNVGTYFRESI